MEGLSGGLGSGRRPADTRARGLRHRGLARLAHRALALALTALLAACIAAPGPSVTSTVGPSPNTAAVSSPSAPPATDPAPPQLPSIGPRGLPRDVQAPPSEPPPTAGPNASPSEPDVPPAAHEAMGESFGARVLCNPYDDIITLTPSAAAAPGYASQWIHAEMWLYQSGVGWRTDLQPVMASTYRHVPVETVSDGFTTYTVRNPRASGTEWTSRPGEGTYATMTYTWWWDGTAWVGPDETWSAGLEYTYSLSPQPGWWCDLTLITP